MARTRAQRAADAAEETASQEWYEREGARRMEEAFEALAGWLPAEAEAAWKGLWLEEHWARHRREELSAQ